MIRTQPSLLSIVDYSHNEYSAYSQFLLDKESIRIHLDYFENTD